MAALCGYTMVYIASCPWMGPCIDSNYKSTQRVILGMALGSYNFRGEFLEEGFPSQRVSARLSWELPNPPPRWVPSPQPRARFPQTCPQGVWSAF